MGALDDVTGKVKEVVGDATGNEQMEAEGRVAQLKEDVKGEAEEHVEEAKDTVGEKVNDVLEGAQEKMDQHKEDEHHS